MNIPLYIFSNISNFIPLIPFFFIYKKNEKPFHIIFLILLLGVFNDGISFIIFNYLRQYHFHLKINDLYRIICLGLWLKFFHELYKHKLLKKYLTIFITGVIILIINWTYIYTHHININSLFEDIYVDIIFIYLCLKGINNQIFKEITNKYKIDGILIFYIAMCIFYSYHLFVMSIYFLEVPLKIKIQPDLFNVVPFLNILINMVYTFSVCFFPKKQTFKFKNQLNESNI
jgi:hypothetical protein